MRAKKHHTDTVSLAENPLGGGIEDRRNITQVVIVHLGAEVSLTWGVYRILVAAERRYPTTDTFVSSTGSLILRVLRRKDGYLPTRAESTCEG